MILDRQEAESLPDKDEVGRALTAMQVVGTTEQQKQSAWHRVRHWEALLSKPVYLYSALFLITAAVFAMYRPLEQRVAGDPAIYDYIAQCILRGQVPYRDVVDIKGPGSYYVTVAAMWLGKLVGLRDVFADRLAHGLMLAALLAAVFKVVSEYFGSRTSGIIACLFMLMSPSFVYWMALGAQPKLPMVLFGMLALLMIRRDRPFWAGVYSMLSCLCWQPGLLFAGAAFLVMSGYLTRWRDLRGIKVAAGMALPLAVTVLYLDHLGALRYFWAYAMQYNYSVFGPNATKPPSEAITHFFKVLNRALGPLMVGFAIAAAGWTVYAFQRLRAKFVLKSVGPPDCLKDAIAIPPLVYFIFCLVNFQGGPDLVLFFPFAGIFIAFFLLEILRMVKSRRTGRGYRVAIQVIPSAVVALMLAIAFEQGLVNWRSGSGFFKAQDAGIKTIGEMLGPADRIYVHGSVELLVLLDRPNLNPYVFMDWGMDDFVADKWYGGSFQKILDEMESQTPRIVLLSRLGYVNRLGHVNHGDDLVRWASQHYNKSSIGGYDVFERKPAE
jgi:hypothetical protein